MCLLASLTMLASTCADQHESRSFTHLQLCVEAHLQRISVPHLHQHKKHENSTSPPLNVTTAVALTIAQTPHLQLRVEEYLQHLRSTANSTRAAIRTPLHSSPTHTSTYLQLPVKEYLQRLRVSASSSIRNMQNPLLLNLTTGCSPNNGANIAPAAWC